jgi:hypothetical protein
VNVRAFPAFLQDTMLVAKDMNTSVPTDVVEALRLRVQCLEGRARRPASSIAPFGIKAIDDRLLEGGLGARWRCTK